MWRLMLLFVPLCLSLLSFGQPKAITAVKTALLSDFDSINDNAWRLAPVATDFVQYFPVYGSGSSTRTEVRILYDNSAIYVRAYLYDDPSLIHKQLTSRDGEQGQDVDYFSVFFDTYNDEQNGFQFLVTPNNVQSDAKVTANAIAAEGEFGDRTWDGVWESKTQLTKDGWIVDMRIPYLSLRFAKKKVQTWGLQFLRFTRRNNESSYWNAVDPNINGFANQFGKYTDLKNIVPPLRLSFSPYLSTGVRFNPDGARKSTEWLRSGGMDVKYGINESFTLDVTLIPDFGQVISDNLVNNLTPFEIKFQENRPFFTEGTELFNKSGLFYSRRIGATPAGYAAIEDAAMNDPDLEVVKNPSPTQLYNAIKFSGRTRKKLGIGVFNAIAAPMHALVRNNITGKETRYETEPLTNYNIIVLDQALQGRSFLTFTNTNVVRSSNNRDANVTALDFGLYDKTNTYNIRGTGRYSKIFAQNGYDGYNTLLRLGKVSGRVQYFGQANVKSDRYNPRDLGFLQTSNEVIYTGLISYNQFSPTKNFLNYKYTFSTNYQRLYKPNVFNNVLFSATGAWLFKNFWDAEVTLNYTPDQHDYFLLGPPYNHFARRPAYTSVTLAGSTDSRKKLLFTYEYLLSKFFDSSDKHYHIIDMGLRYRFSNKFTLELSNRHEAETNYIVYAGKETNGDPIIGFVDFKDVTSIISGTYNFTPRINLLFRGRHYWSHVPYNRFANVDGDGNAIARDPGSPTPDVDANVNIFNLDAFLTWDFRLGSRIVAGWKNWMGDAYAVNGTTHKSYLGNFGRTFNTSHGNEFTLRFIYFLDYNQLRKKH